MILYLVCDTSGSMSEAGKHLIARGMVRATEQFFRLEGVCAELKLISWSLEARLIEWSPDLEYPEEMLLCKGSAKAEALIKTLGELPAEKILLITDGFWTKKDTATLKKWRESLSNDTLRILKIGADSNPQLKGPDVFATEEFFAVMAGWVEGAIE